MKSHKRKRALERVECPFCKRDVAVYVPSRGDGSDVKIVRHVVDRNSPTCKASGLMLGEISR